MNYPEVLIKKAEEIRLQSMSLPNFSEANNYVQDFNKLNVQSCWIGGISFRESLMEISIFAETSLFLVMHGFYEQANGVFRQLLDDFLIRLYFDRLIETKPINQRNDKNGRNTKDYVEWKLGLSSCYPRKNVIKITLLENRSLNTYNSQFQIFQKLEEFIKKLSKYVHNRPETRHYPGASRSSICNIGFNEKKFNEWLENLKTIYRYVLIISCLFYPNVLKFNIIFTENDLYREDLKTIKECYGIKPQIER